MTPHLVRERSEQVVQHRTGRLEQSQNTKKNSLQALGGFLRIPSWAEIKGFQRHQAGWLNLAQYMRSSSSCTVRSGIVDLSKAIFLFHLDPDFLPVGRYGLGDPGLGDGDGGVGQGRAVEGGRGAGAY